MKKTNFKKSRFRAAAKVFVLSFAVACLGSSESFAGNTGSSKLTLGPKWMGSSGYLLQNDSFLSDIRNDLFQTRSLSSQLLSHAQALNLRQQYDDLMRDEEDRRKYGLVDHDSEAVFSARLSDFGQSVLDQVRAKQVDENRQKVIGVSHDAKLDKAAETVAEDAPKPVMVAASIAYAAYSGTPVNVALDPKTHVSAWANVPAGTGQIAVQSKLFDSSVDVAAFNPGSPAEIAGRSLTDGTLDRYRFTVSRQVPALDLTSGVSYGTTTTTLAASLSKPLAKNTIVVFDSLHPLTSMDQSEERLQLMYGLNF